MSMSIKKGDNVKVLSGKDRGKTGTVLRALPSEGKVVVEGVAIVKKAVKPNPQNQQGGIVSQEAAIDALQRSAHLPQVRPVHSRWPQEGRQEQASRLQEVRR